MLIVCCDGLTGFPEAVEGSGLGRRDPSAVKSFHDAWDRFTTFLAFPSELRRVVYTTNSIESLNCQRRKVTKERSSPSDQRRAEGRLVEGQVVTNWKQALEQLALAYPDRINPHL